MGHKLEVLNFDVICKKDVGLGHRGSKTANRGYIIRKVVWEMDLGHHTD